MLSLAGVPEEYMAATGRLASAALVMLLLSMVLALFPVVPDVVAMAITPEEELVVEPLRVQYLIVLEEASLTRRMVAVPAALELLVLLITMLLAAPVADTRPSMVTLTAPFRSISGAARFPVMEIPPTAG